ncbi:MAG TPA: hypothetical protein VKR52_18660 [Terracidiphilus sp.]|nr:hypothetical protein [Terracidiphilus sp.]
MKRVLRLLLFVCLVKGVVWAAPDPFVGKWKLNPSRSKLTDEMKVAAAGENKYRFDFGSGNTETIVVDGTDQPGIFGTTLAVSAEGADKWKVVRKKDGRVQVTGIWTLSSDGKTLTDEFTAPRADGSVTSLHYIYERNGDGSGFAGTWDSTTEQVNSTFEIEIAPFGDDGLSFITPAQKMTQNLKFDGKDYPATGPNLPDGFGVSGRRIDSRSLDLRSSIQGKVLYTQHVEVSPDQRTLTMTTHAPSRAKPNVMVFEREP